MIDDKEALAAALRIELWYKMMGGPSRIPIEDAILVARALLAKLEAERKTNG